MKTFNLIILGFFLISCSTLKKTEIYGKEMEVVDNVRSRVMLRDLNGNTKNKSFLTFTTGFNNHITVINDNNIILNEYGITSLTLSLTTGCIIVNNKTVKILIDKKDEIELNKEQLPKYKFIYIEKDNDNYIIEYTNKAKSFR